MTYHMVEDSFWTDDKIVVAPNSAKQVMLFLMTGPQANLTGCACVRVATIADALYGVEMGNDEHMLVALKRVKDGLAYLKDNGIIIRCDETGWTWMANHLKHRPIPNPKAGIAAMKIIRTIPQNLFFYQKLMEAYRIHSHESVKRCKSGNGVLCLKQINALIQSHRKRYSIDTVCGQNEHHGEEPKQDKIEDKKGSENDNENMDLLGDTQSDTVPVTETVIDTPPLSPPSGGKKKRRRKSNALTYWPEGFELTEGMIEYANEKAPGADVGAMFEEFREHHRDKKASRFKDWTAAWKTWCRNPYPKPMLKVINGANGYGRSGKSNGRSTLEQSRNATLDWIRGENSGSGPDTVGGDQPPGLAGSGDGDNPPCLDLPFEEVPDAEDRGRDGTPHENPEMVAGHR